MPASRRPSATAPFTPWNQTLFSSFHMKEENLDSYVDEMERSGIVAIEAYPSTAFVLP